MSVCVRGRERKREREREREREKEREKEREREGTVCESVRYLRTVVLRRARLYQRNSLSCGMEINFTLKRPIK